MISADYKYWADSVTLLLIESYRTVSQKYESKISKKGMWEEIAAMLGDQGHNYTSTQCSTKFKYLKRRYRTVKDHNNRSGAEKLNWQLYDVCIFFNLTPLLYVTRISFFYLVGNARIIRQKGVGDATFNCVVDRGIRIWRNSEQKKNKFS